MNKQFLEYEFNLLVSIANKAWDKGVDCSDYQKEILDILWFVERYPDNKSEFVSLFCKIISNADRGNWEIVTFCMRKLQWLEVKEYIENILISLTDYRKIEMMEDILNAYEDEWEDEYMWPYFNKSGN